MQLIVNIIVLSAIYALIACGYVLIYRVSRVMNLAHGELMMLGAYLLFTTASLFVGHPIIAIAVAVMLSLVVGILVYVLLMRKMTGEMVLAAILTTVALGILLRGLVVLFWSAAQQHPLQALRFSNPPIELFGGARISTCAALIVLMTVVVYGALFTFLRFGRWGVRMRAAGQNPLLAAQRGINLHAVSAALRCGAVPRAHRHADRAPLGPVRHAGGARPCLGNRAPAAISAPTTRRISP